MKNQSPKSSIDWLELDRLVDGRLSGDAYRELLCQIDADPDGWRQCAMAFLEHQALTNELSSFAADPACDILPCLGSIVAEEKQGSIEPAIPAKTLARTGLSSSTGSRLGWLSMALCIVGGLAMGFTLQSDFRDRLEPPVLTTSNRGLNIRAATVEFNNERPEEVYAESAVEASSEEMQASNKKGCSKKRCQPSRRITLVNLKKSMQEQHDGLE